ncbi:hypothetical protein SUGI_0605050 [Cryptomeria japonica]|nr:hypothetical protein SUGI_0605050 [Cryptomeria japonica]
MIGSNNNTCGSNLCLISPAPYVLCGVSAMLALVAFLLILLVCYFHKTMGEDHITGDCSLHVKNIDSQEEKRVMVIMAGEDKPTFLPKPLATKPCAAR